MLLVDPDPDTRAQYERSLTTAGFEVTQAADGREALTKALVYSPGLVVMELQLPLIDSFALCEILRRDRATARTPILVVTDIDRPADVERIRRVGADAVVLKPVSPDVLAQRASLLVAASNGSPLAAEKGIWSPSPDADRSLTQPPQERRIPSARRTRREVTTAPQLPPPPLTCPSCDRPLTYCVSHTGGVSERHPEQWDYFSCLVCGGFQYRHRTRKIRRLDKSEEEWMQQHRESARD